MKKFRITYLAFPQSDIRSSDIVMYAKDEEEAKQLFRDQYKACSFISAKEEM